MCSIIGVGERLHKVLGQIDRGTLDSGERSLPCGLLVLFCQNILHRNCIFHNILFHFSTIFCSQSTKCLGSGQNLGRVRKPETHMYIFFALL